MATYNFLDKTGLGQVWAKIKGLIPMKTSDLQNDSGFITEGDISQSDWIETDSTDDAFILNKPAIKTGEGENSVIINKIEEDPEAATYTLKISGTMNNPIFTFTTEDTLPSASDLKHYGVIESKVPGTSVLNKWQKIKDIDLTNNIITLYNKLSTSTGSFTDQTIIIYYKHYGTIGSSTSESVVEGAAFITSGEAHAEGRNTLASGNSAHAEGCETFAAGNYSHAEGYNSYAGGSQAHAEGRYTEARGSYSHAEGRYTIASSQDQHVQGKYNIEDTNSLYADIVGNGTSDSARSNAYTLDWSGNGVYTGKVTAGAGPTEDMDLATKQYVDTATSDITSDLAGLTDTTITTPADGQILSYDGTTSKWVNADAPFVPTNVSAFTNDSGYLTLATLPIYDGTVTTGGAAS